MKKILASTSSLELPPAIMREVEVALGTPADNPLVCWGTLEEKNSGVMAAVVGQTMGRCRRHLIMVGSDGSVQILEDLNG